MIRLRRFFGLVACGWLSWAGTVHVDAVTDWNQHTATAIISPVPTGAGKPAALGLEVPPTVVVLRGSPQHLGNTMKHVLLRELLGRTLSFKEAQGGEKCIAQAAALKIYPERNFASSVKRH